MTVWMVRKTGSDTNGGTSASVLATAADGVTSAGNSNLTSASGLFTPAMVGHQVAMTGHGARLITAYNSATSVTYAGAPIGAFSGLSFRVGGAMLTINSLMQSFPVAGDSVYIGAGVYRETISLNASGTAGLPISVFGDYDGAVTGDPGEVQITNYLVNDKTAAGGTTTLSINTSSFLSFANLTIISGFAVLVASGFAGSHDLTFTDCHFLSLSNSATLNFTDPGARAPLNLLFDRCTVFSNQGSTCINIQLTTAAGADFDVNVTIKNSLIVFVSNANRAINFSGTGSLSGKPGGVRCHGTTILGGAACFGTSGGGTSTSIPCEIRGSMLIGALGVQALTLGPVVEDHNLIYAGTARSNVAIGPGSVSNNSYAPLFDIGQAYKLSGIARPFLSPSSPTSPLLGFGQSMQNTGGPPGAFLQQLRLPPGSPGWRPPALMLDAVQSNLGAQVPMPTYDWANRPRPAGTQSNLPTVGYMEFHDTALRDAVLFDAGPYSGKFVGPGDEDMLVPVDTGSQTFSVKVYVPGAYGSGRPMPSATLLANGEIGVAAQIVSADPTVRDSWQTLTFAAINPTASGILKVRFTSFDDKGTTQVNFDTFAVA